MLQILFAITTPNAADRGHSAKLNGKQSRILIEVFIFLKTFMCENGIIF